MTSTAYNKAGCSNFRGDEAPELAADEGCVHGGCVLVTVSTGACRRPQVVIWLWLAKA